MADGLYGNDDKWFDFLSIGKVPHYYGDIVRQLFLAVAVISFVSIPVWGDLLPFGTLVQVGGMVLLVLLAGLTHPHSRMVLVYDAVVAGIGIMLLELAAINNYQTQGIELFIARELSVVLLLFAFYYSIKTARAMSLGKVGKPEAPSEFFDNPPGN